MSQIRLARFALMLAAIGLNAAPALTQTAAAQASKSATIPTAPQAPGAANGAAQPKPDGVRPELLKLLDPATIKPLMDAKNYTEVQSRITQADAIADKTPYETYVVNRMKLSLGTATNNEQMQQSALEAVLASGKLSDAEKPNFTLALATTYYNAKNYPKAIELYKQLQASGVNTDQVNNGLMRSYYFSGDYATVVKMQGPQLDAEVKAGKTPADAELRMYASSANKAKDDAAYMRGLELLATYYPNDDYWSDLINRAVLRKAGYDRSFDTDTLRLEFAAVKKMSPEVYTDLAELALKDGFPTEAKKVMDAGFAANVLGTGSGAAAERQLRDRATKEAASDAKNIASGEASATKSKTGAGLVNLGWAYVTMDQFDKGIPFIEQGIAKGSLKSTDEAKLRLGMAYARAGQKDKAIQTFQGVTGKGGAADIARCWIILLNHPNTGGASAS
ncbi:tetratricopeptide repeat protein [Massilia sp. 9096]|uniref:tetratricopeptide repeat protein n=1 Tax=Massilia sp. 9096 TaxID=1500894 RepID=UPI00056403C9|nr:tetratricopeptide repeat protein [Massilia sp. 9096]